MLYAQQIGLPLKRAQRRPGTFARINRREVSEGSVGRVGRDGSDGSDTSSSRSAGWGRMEEWRQESYWDQIPPLASAEAQRPLAEEHTSPVVRQSFARW